MKLGKMSGNPIIDSIHRAESTNSEVDFMRIQKVVTVIAMIVCAVASAQEPFFGSSRLQLFNRGEYQAAIDSIRAWMKRTPAEAELGYYYIGESRYNLGLASANASDAVNHFDEALAAFDECLKRVPLRESNPYLSDNARYKKAWTFFRVSELRGGAADDLEKARSLFRDLSQSTDDSVRVAALYMEGETSLRLAEHQRLRIAALDQGFLAQKAVDGCIGAASSFRAAASDPAASPDLRTASLIRFRDASFDRGCVYESASGTLFASIRDPRKASSAAATAAELFRRTAYSGLADSASFKAQPVLAASELAAALHTFLNSGSAQDRQSLDRLLESQAASAAERGFMRGLRDSRDIANSAGFRDNETFTNRIFALVEQNLAPAYTALPEARFWAGRLNALTGAEEARAAFDTFLRETEGSAGDFRTRVLREDARLQLLSMSFEKAVAAGSASALRSFIVEADQFRPETAFVREKKAALRDLASVLLDPKNVWQNLEGSPDVRIEAIFGIVRNLLVRANQVVGQDRRNILNKIKPLFEFTQRRRESETRYYEGLYRFLDAEIQVKNKGARFKDAADRVKDCSGEFELEGKYLRARSLLAADEFDDARGLFISLINEGQSVRAAYFLGEILRQEKMTAAARQCYEAVLRKTEGAQGGEIWANAAVAANRSIDESREALSGGTEVLNGVRLDAIQYPERWSRGGDVSVEQFVESVYQKTVILQEGLSLMLRYGIPKDAITPSVFPTPGVRPRFAAFGAFNAGIRERTGAVLSTLVLSIAFPDGIGAGASVFINGEPVELDGNGSVQKTYSLGDTASIRVTGDGFYPVFRTVKFSLPRQTRIVISLVPALSFVRTDARGGADLMRFAERLDGNAVFIPGGGAGLAATGLVRAFQSNVAYRDFAYSRAHQGYLVTQARKGQILLYRDAANHAVEEEFRVQFPDTTRLVSPEGIAADSRGNVYVADWARHLIHVFGPDGVLIRSFGGFGENGPAEVGKPARFCYPSRIAVAEDLEGVELQGDRFHRPIELFVTDRNGIHFLDENGTYLNSVVMMPQEKGSLTALSVEGYGARTSISAYNRRTGEVQRFLGAAQTAR
jgi:hypothetical protein